jgi:hypothetical protein
MRVCMCAPRPCVHWSRALTQAHARDMRGGQICLHAGTHLAACRNPNLLLPPRGGRPLAAGASNMNLFKASISCARVAVGVRALACAEHMHSRRTVQAQCAGGMGVRHVCMIAVSSLPCLGPAAGTQPEERRRGRGCRAAAGKRPRPGRDATMRLRQHRVSSVTARPPARG